MVTGTEARLVEDPAETDVLLASWTDGFHYHDMVDALRAIDEDTVFLGTDPAGRSPVRTATRSPVPGRSQRRCRRTSGIRTGSLGKPSESRQAALERLDCAPTSVL